MLVITLGEVLSVNIELVSHLLANALHKPSALLSSPVVLVGSAWHWQEQRRRLGLTALPLEPRLITSLEAAHQPGLYFLDIARRSSEKPAEALSRVERGFLAVQALQTLSGFEPKDKLAVLTAPIDKHVCHEAAFTYPGQTEFFQDLWGGEATMILAGPRLRVGLVTNHLPLSAVPAAISGPLIERKLRLFLMSLKQFYGIQNPRLAVLSLNPHAGDNRLFGDEDADIIAPAIAAAKRQHPECELMGPLPADTAFYQAYQGRYDGVLAMYHDQGLGPLKTVHFDEAVNLSGGLRHLRVSPDHGPAADLYLKKEASPRSFAAALSVVQRYLKGES